MITPTKWHLGDKTAIYTEGSVYVMRCASREEAEHLIGEHNKLIEPTEPKPITRMEFTVLGRPAPQGSKKRGNAGQLREASPYLPAWRAAVKRAAYERYVELGVEPGDLPLLRGAIAFGCTFWMPPGHRVDAPPDLDKLLRAVWDSLTAAQVWQDDGRVIEVDYLNKTLATVDATGKPVTGAVISVRALDCQSCGGSGVCAACAGWAEPEHFPCPACGGSGRCECCPKNIQGERSPDHG